MNPKYVFLCELLSRFPKMYIVNIRKRWKPPVRNIELFYYAIYIKTTTENVLYSSIIRLLEIQKIVSYKGD